MNRATSYRGRLAPSPTGYLHLGHAYTFWLAQERARSHGGALVLRNENLDAARCKPEYVQAMIEDLRWFGFAWDEGPDVGGPCAPYNQGERMGMYRAALAALRARDFVYPCTCSRKDIQAALAAPHAGEDEAVYPGNCRPNREKGPRASGMEESRVTLPPGQPQSAPPAWRFRAPENETIAFMDGHLGPQEFLAGRDFGDFVVWRGDDVPAYQLACVVDDAAMGITEVVRGADLLVSTARQILLYRALGLRPPNFHHSELLRDPEGRRLSKRDGALALRQLRARGESPAGLRAGWGR